MSFLRAVALLTPLLEVLDIMEFNDLNVIIY